MRFHDFFQNLNEADAAAAAPPPGDAGGLGMPGALPPGGGMGGPGMMPPSGGMGGGMGMGMGGPPPMGGMAPPAGGQQGPEKLKATSVWDVLEKLFVRGAAK